MNPIRLRDMEIEFGVRIADDAHPFAVQLLLAYENEPSLQEMLALDLVEAACKRINIVREDRLLDWDEYCLHRAFVEATELRREKSVACRTDILPRVEEELAELTRKWDRFRNKWFRVLEHQSHGPRRRIIILQRLRSELSKFEDGQRVSQQFPALIDEIVRRLQRTVHPELVDVVGPSQVAQAASDLTGLPEGCFYPPFELRILPPIQDLKQGLSKELIALDGVIDKIVCALSKQKSERGPLGSFLLLGPRGCGKLKLAKSLAEVVYGDRQRYIKLNVSRPREADVVRIILSAIVYWSQKNGYVVIFEYVESIDEFMNELLPRIIWEGNSIRTEDGESVSFSNSIVLVSSHVFNTLNMSPHLQYLHDATSNRPLRQIMADNELRMNDQIFERLSFEVENEFSSDFLDLFNDLIVFPSLSLQNYMAISRLQARDAAVSMGNSFNTQVIIYPSDAALVNMMNLEDLRRDGAHAHENWYDKNLESILMDEPGDKLIIYVDHLVGLDKEFSFRVENATHLERNPTFKSLSTLRSIFRREKLQSRDIHRLRVRCSHLCELLSRQPPVDLRSAHEESWQALQLIDSLFLREEASEVTRLDYFISEAEVSRKLQAPLKQRDGATQAVTEALLRSVRTSEDEQAKARPASFLCLGLRPQSQKRFAESLLKNLVMDDGKQLLVEVDLAQAGSFFQCLTYTPTEMLVTEAVRRIPNSVVVFRNLETADMPVVSTILSILDSGEAVDCKGNATSFENCVVVIISDLGNKQIISRLISDRKEEDEEEAAESSESAKRAKHEAAESSSKEGSDESSSTDQMGPTGLRYELLYRLDQLWLFDPFSDDQLNRFGMLPIKQLEEEDHSLYKAFSHLINQVCEENLDEVMQQIKEAVGKDLIIW